MKLGGVSLVLSPLDIHNKEFTRGIRGVNVEEVNELHEQVKKEYEITIQKNKELNKKLKEMQEQMEHYADIEETLNKSIVVAQETSEELKANARKEAQLIKKEADKNADRMVNDELSESRKITYETEEMKRQSNVFRTRVKMLIKPQLDMINNDD